MTTWPKTAVLLGNLTAAWLLSRVTTCGAAESLPLLATKFVSPLYLAVIVCLPTESFVVKRMAWPPFTFKLDMEKAPSKKVTVPVGIPLPGATGRMVAVSPRDCPYTEDRVEELIATVVAARLTSSLYTADTTPVKLPSPLYQARIE
jgi:hypothetical protein